MKKILISIISICVMLPLFTAHSVSADSFTVAAKSAIAIDADSGKILYAQNATDSSTQIASVTKLVTAYLVYQKIDEGKLSWDTKVPISTYAYDLTLNSAASNVKMTKGEKISVKDLMNALMLPSANSAAVALAEQIAGSEPKFVDLMRAQLKTWGITDAKIYNASGLPNSLLGKNIYPNSATTDVNTMSAEDVAIVSYHLLKDYPQILDITKQTQMTFDKDGSSKATMNTTNQMLKGYAQYRSGVDGLKTGSTGYQINCFAATTYQNGFRIITVILEADSPATDNSTTFNLTNLLMNHIYGSWTTDTLVSKGKVYKDFTKFNVIDGKQKTVKLVAKKDITPVVPKAEDGTANSKNLTVTTDKKTSASTTAAVKKGTTLVTIRTSLKDSLGYIPGASQAEFPLIAADTVDRATPIVVIWNHFVKFVNEKL
ncbi:MULTISPECIES: serine hydrolase [unclassified Lactococcus]|uniref:serine hydrolase n=1 Tax=unclassified Lactococcus TaxID=2643510 RepID=UPI0011CA4B12|nr:MULTISPECIES: serine hydrolase [unclassified Lactococcus]MQW24042.1 serine hydrolase [Lactococcus sp. dk101]TXK36652.1 D-alanyl-D-alanine carboxypeptidase [Lactococcus sp. dk310]TXK46421.1 D-alanyl-D-alanine carboxypeptidase [Lactococcus sp. dk322]